MPPDQDRVAEKNHRANTLLALLAVAQGPVLYAPPPSAYAQCAYDVSTVAGRDCGGFGSPTLGRSINQVSEVVGQYTVCGIGTSEAFFWDGGQSLVTLERPSGVGGAGAWDINDAGLIVGQMVVSGVGDRAFLYDGTQFIDLGTLPGGTFSRGRGINGLGQVVGTWGNEIIGNPALAAFLWQDGVMLDLNGDLGTSASEARDINELGHVAGWMGTSSVIDAHAFIWENGNAIDLGVIPNGFTAVATAINSSKHVVGSGRQPLVDPPFFAGRAFLWNSGTMVLLENLAGFENASAADINDSGEIVGVAYGVGGNPNIEAGVVWRNGVVIDLNDFIPAKAGVHITVARAINNQGQITGQADTDNGDVVAVLLTPVEQPVGDLDGDCQVGIIDFLMLLSLWGPCSPACPPSCTGDVDGDCAVGVIDFLTLLAHWG